MNYKIDLQKIADELDFDLEDVEMLIEVFLEGANENLNKLKNAIEIDNMEEIRRSAHAIKGSAANLTLANIAEIAKDIEDNARKSNTFDYAKQYKKLKLYIENICEG